MKNILESNVVTELQTYQKPTLIVEQRFVHVVGASGGEVTIGMKIPVLLEKTRAEQS